ncbi:unnamed protein product [Prorocentrum cordatum]|uniref:Uncharacterized protein n=1 Tax=Prorocentrum cordatum TaxID=2364126 RepID=A0ABN9SAS3_9DINO|nr:unnamed protein product [Polarella glacialis]
MQFHRLRRPPRLGNFCARGRAPAAPPPPLRPLATGRTTDAARQTSTTDQHGRPTRHTSTTSQHGRPAQQNSKADQHGIPARQTNTAAQRRWRLRWIPTRGAESSVPGIVDPDPPVQTFLALRAYMIYRSQWAGWHARCPARAAWFAREQRLLRRDLADVELRPQTLSDVRTWAPDLLPP